MLPPNKLCMLLTAPGVESALHRSLTGDSKPSHRLGKSLKFTSLGIIANKHAAEKLACVCRNIDRIWRRYGPQLASHDDGFSDGSPILANED